MTDWIHCHSYPLASPKNNLYLIPLSNYTYVQIQTSELNSARFYVYSPPSYLWVFSHTFKCGIPLHTTHSQPWSVTAKPLNQETFDYDNNRFSCRKSLPGYFKAANGWRVRCTCDLDALMMVIKNSCVPASNYSFMEELKNTQPPSKSAPCQTIIQEILQCWKSYRWPVTLVWHC